MRTLFFAFAASLLISVSHADDGAALAKVIASSVEDGDSIARLRMRVAPVDSGFKAGTVYQLQVKARRSAGASDVLYQILWPRDQKGEALLLSQGGQGAISGKQLSASGAVSDVGSANATVMGSDLTFEDVITNFFRWGKQSVVGEESIGNAQCTMLLSEPGSGDSSSYTSVKSWIDKTKLIPLRIEKYGSGGKLVLKIESDRISTDDRGKKVPSRLVAQRTGSGTITEVEGTKIRHDVVLDDSTFSEAGMAELK